MMGKTMQRNALGELDLDQMYRALPLISALDDLGENPYYRGVIEHEKYGQWWDRYSLRDRYDQVETPSLFITGWFDSLLHETLKVFNGWTRYARSDDARRLTRLVVGPWSHQTAPWGRQPFDPGGRYEELELRPAGSGRHRRKHTCGGTTLVSRASTPVSTRSHLSGCSSWERTSGDSRMNGH